MKIRSLSNLTRTYILALSALAFLTIATFLTLHQVIITQKDSARLVNISGSQRWLSQKVAFLSLEMVYLSNNSERDQSRKQLLGSIDKIRDNHQELVQNSSLESVSGSLSPHMQSMYFKPPISMQERIKRYTSEAQALANEPVQLLTLENPHLNYVLKNRENILESLNQIVSLYQQESEAKVQRLQVLETASVVTILLTLAFLGLYVFRPITKTLLEERAQLEIVNQELSLLSSVDGLTGIPNRRCFDEFLAQLWSLAERNGEPIAIIMCDIDFFKVYNDTYGHLQGDECLRMVASTLKNSLKRQGDFVGRYGGEEFVVVLPNSNLEGATMVAETLRTNLENLAIPHPLSSMTSNVTISLGIAIGYATFNGSPKPLILAADHALYQSKQDGRNRYTVAPVPFKDII